ncbi:MAG: CarD family transcriptional regulator, partial [bacterium]|nr:CarD family transcriptional regulator [bacterium]
MELSRLETDKVLIVSVTPYFLEKGNFWFEENLNKILKSRKTQSFFEDNTLFLTKGQKINLSQVLRKLDEMGYEKMLQVQDPGEFSQRGGILDVFPINPVVEQAHYGAGLNCAVRIEFFGNEIESIQLLANIKTKNTETAKELLKKKLKSQRLYSDLKGLKPGDYLVHLDHGIGRFTRIMNYELGIMNKYYVLDYAQGDKLYVPLGLERKLSRYVGFVEPKISRLGSLTWQRIKRRVKEEAEKLAKELLEIYAKRTVSSRPAYLPEDEIDFQITNNFKYEETPDQIQALEDIKKDLEKEEPMDRIVCGDVGFGKTEVAFRTMIRAVKSGY